MINMGNNAKISDILHETVKVICLKLTKIIRIRLIINK